MARWKVNRELLPVKAHYFFFFAALGPLLPQMNVYGRQLGISPEVMGLVTAVLPLLWAVAKPCFGYLVDYFTNQRKLVFMLLIAIMSGSYCGLWFLPEPAHHQTPDTVLETIYRLNSSVHLRRIANISISTNDSLTVVGRNSDGANNFGIESNFSKLKESTSNLSKNYIKDPLKRTTDKKLKNVPILNENDVISTNVFKKYNCHWDCERNSQFFIWLTIHNDVIHEMYIDRDINNATCEEINMVLVNFNNDLACKPIENCNLLCMNEDSISNGSTIFSKEISSMEIGSDTDILFNGTQSSDNKATGKLTESESLNETLRQNDESNLLKESGTKADPRPNNGTKTDTSAKTTKVLVAIDPIAINQMASSETQNDPTIYGTVTFWGFVILMCVGTVAFNVANCIGDAVCFDVLGPERMSRYGTQRAWGTVGYGATAFLGGWLVNLASDGTWSNFTPAFVLAAALTLLDLISCRKLNLPKLTSAEETSGVLWEVLKCPRVLVFLCFAVVAGMFDSFIIYYMFWYLEELAEKTSQAQDIKLLEGIIVFGQSLVGELLFFFLSGRILKRFGHGITMTACLLSYSLRLAFVPLITNPWHLVPIEAIMQGPTYALTYATIVGYAAGVAPEGHSATMQGIVAGVDDGLGFALGSLVGGQLYGCVGGANAFRVMALLALFAAVMHAVLHKTILGVPPKAQAPSELTPEEAEKMLENNAYQPHGNSIYCDTVIPLNPSDKTPVGTNNSQR